MKNSYLFILCNLKLKYIYINDFTTQVVLGFNVSPNCAVDIKLGKHWTRPILWPVVHNPKTQTPMKLKYFTIPSNGNTVTSAPEKGMVLLVRWPPFDSVNCGQLLCAFPPSSSALKVKVTIWFQHITQKGKDGGGFVNGPFSGHRSIPTFYNLSRTLQTSDKHSLFLDFTPKKWVLSVQVVSPSSLTV